MKKQSLTKYAKNVEFLAKKHSPEILLGLGITGLLTSIVLGIKATPKALELMEEEQDRKVREEETLEYESLTPLETVKVAWKCYVPTVATAIVSTGCLIGSHSISSKRNAALATAYAVCDTAFKEYKEKVVETIGEKKEKTVRDDIAKDRIKKNPPNDNSVVMTGKGTTLCFDHMSGQYFQSDIDMIKKVVNDLNRRMISENYISLNEFYYELGLKATKQGESIGWNIEDGYIDVDFSAQLENDKPCICIDYDVSPRADFRSLY